MKNGHEIGFDINEENSRREGQGPDGGGFLMRVESSFLFMRSYSWCSCLDSANNTYVPVLTQQIILVALTQTTLSLRMQPFDV